MPRKDGFAQQSHSVEPNHPNWVVVLGLSKTCLRNFKIHCMCPGSKLASHVVNPRSRLRTTLRPGSANEVRSGRRTGQMTGVDPNGPSLSAEDVASYFSKRFSYVPSSPSSFRTPSSPTASVASSCESTDVDSLQDCLVDADRCAHELTATMSAPPLPRSSVVYHGRLQRHLPAWSAMASPYIAG